MREVAAFSFLGFCAFALLFALCACAPAPAPVISSCPSVKPWTKAEQMQIFAAERALPPDSILIPVIIDYARLRSALRAAK